MWLIAGVVLVAVAAGGFVLGVRAGQRRAADAMVRDPEVGRAVLERLALVHGARLEYFALPAPSGRTDAPTFTPEAA